MRKVIPHLLCWLFYISYTLVSTKINSPARVFYFADLSVFYISDIFIFYFLFFIVFPQIVISKKFKTGIFYFLLGVVVFFYIQYSRLYVKQLTFPISEKIPDFYYNPPQLVLALLPNLIQFIAFSFIFWTYENSKKQNTEKLALEKRNHEIEVSFLKSQINQHFIYNMLNMFYVNTMQYSEKLAGGILSLSELMRFSVSHEQSSLIPLNEEVKYIESYINLNQLRFNEQLQVNFKTTGDLESFKIPHLSILTLVENAFKHGNLKIDPLYISIDAKEHELEVNLKNKKRTAQIEHTTGIGLKNLERRLSLLLENKFTLTTKEEDDFFYTQLIIKK
jgi:two-component system, LytTR family, sensor kinase